MVLPFIYIYFTKVPVINLFSEPIIGHYRCQPSHPAGF